MEASDVFAQDIGAGEDPFAEEWNPQEEAAEPPIVDREGNRLDGAPAHAPTDGASVESQDGQRPAPESGVEPDSPAPEPAVSAQEAAQPQADPPAPAQAASAQPAAGSEAKAEAAAEDPPTEPAPSTESAADAQNGTAASTPERESAGSADGGDEVAEPPEEVKDEAGKVTKRRYYILRQDDADKFTKLAWYEDKDGKMTTKGAPGSKKQTVALARTTDEALKIGFAAAGAPTDGITLIPVAALHFQPKKVRPAPPEPSRVRLQIS